MDKKTVLALVLCAAVIMLFQLFYFAPAERDAARQRQLQALLDKAAQDSVSALSGQAVDASGSRDEGVPGGSSAAGESAGGEQGVVGYSGADVAPGGATAGEGTAASGGRP
ncbi:MAG: hypothetical protein V2A71_01315, partial [Candidatus Eisenbacteria bacterium]